MVKWSPKDQVLVETLVAFQNAVKVIAWFFHPNLLLSLRDTSTVVLKTCGRTPNFFIITISLKEMIQFEIIGHYYHYKLITVKTSNTLKVPL